jgi:hypothetical protein
MGACSYYILCIFILNTGRARCWFWRTDRFTSITSVALTVGLVVRRASRTLWRFWKNENILRLPIYNIASLVGYPASTLFNVETELSGVTHMRLFLDCHECLHYFHKLLVWNKIYCKKIISCNWKSWILSAVCVIQRVTFFWLVQVQLHSQGVVMWGTLAQFTAGLQGRYFPIVTRWMISKLEKNDSPNCKTEPDNRIL